MENCIQDSDNDSEKPGSKAQPVASSECERGKAEQQNDPRDEEAEPNLETECREGEKWQTGADGANAGIVGGEKVVLRFVGHMKREGGCECEPCDSESLAGDGSLR